MRKLFWCGVILATMTIVAVCVVAEYAELYPDSPMGCCARTICDTAAMIDPIARMAGRLGRAAHQTMSEPAPCEAAVDGMDPAQPLDVIDLSMIASAETGGEEEATAPDASDPVQAVEAAQTDAEADQAVTVPPIAFENDAAIEEDPIPEIMPPAKDEDEDDGEACEASKMEDLIQEQIDQFRKAETEAADEAAKPEELPMPNEAEDQVADEAAEPEELPMPNEAEDQAGSEQPQSEALDLQQRLDVPVTLEFKDTPLEQVVEDLRILLNVNIVVDQETLEKEGIAADWPISISMEEVTTRSALDMILSNFNLIYLVKDDSIYVTTPNGVKAMEGEQHPGHCQASGCGGCYPAKAEADEEDHTAEKKTDEGKDDSSEKKTDEDKGDSSVPPIVWRAHDRDDELPKTAEDKANYISSFWMGLFDFPEELPMPAEVAVDDEPADQGTADESPMTDAPPAGEESEALPGTPPDCREDPHHDQQYPGCPYMGGCPGMHATPAHFEVQHKAGVEKKDASVRPEMVEDTAIRRMKYEEFATPSAERPTHPDHYDWLPAMPTVDTMEFRKSDAKPDEFNPKPF